MDHSGRMLTPGLTGDFIWFISLLTFLVNGANIVFVQRQKEKRQGSKGRDDERDKKWKKEQPLKTLLQLQCEKLFSN